MSHGALHYKGDSYTWIDVILTDESDTKLESNNNMATFLSFRNAIDVRIQYQQDRFTPFQVNQARRASVSS